MNSVLKRYPWTQKTFSVTAISTLEIFFLSSTQLFAPLTIESPNQITIGNLNLAGVGDLSIISRQAGITIGNITDSSSLDFLDSANINLQAPGAIVTGNISAIGRSVEGVDSNGGNVTLQSQTSITTGAIDTSTDDGNAGNVVLDPPGDVIFTFIDASSTAGAGGNVTVVSTQGNVRGVGTIVDTDTTIDTSGAIADGNITITHGGGNAVPF